MESSNQTNPPCYYHSDLTVNTATNFGLRTEPFKEVLLTGMQSLQNRDVTVGRRQSDLRKAEGDVVVRRRKLDLRKEDQMLLLKGEN
jgi:hypothetical protein